MGYDRVCVCGECVCGGKVRCGAGRAWQRGTVVDCVLVILSVSVKTFVCSLTDRSLTANFTAEQQATA